MNIRILEMHEGKFSSEELKEVFDRVRNLEHWKLPTEVLVEEKGVDITMAALTHYHGGVADCELSKEENGVKWFRVESPGYMCD